jgi:hypothetical protein
MGKVWVPFFGVKNECVYFYLFTYFKMKENVNILKF